jgi:hypothetical protein
MEVNTSCNYKNINNVVVGDSFSLVGNFESFLCMDIGVEMNKNGKGWLWDVKVMVFPLMLKRLSTLEKWKKVRRKDKGLSGFSNTNP